MGTSSVPSQEPRAPWEKGTLSPEDQEVQKNTAGVRHTQQIRDKMHELERNILESLGMH
jgi:hypothetical protein